MEFIVCLILSSLLASVFTGGRIAQDIIATVTGHTPPHLERAKLRAERERLANQRAKQPRQRSPYATDKPRLADVAAVYWGDAMADAIDSHNRRRKEKAEQKRENQTASEQGRQAQAVRPSRLDRIKRLGSLIMNGPAPAAQGTPAVQGVDVAEAVTDTMTGPRIACDECGTTLIDEDYGYRHPSTSTCPKAGNGSTAPPQPAAAAAQPAPQQPSGAQSTKPAPKPAPEPLRQFIQAQIKAAKVAFDAGRWNIADAHLNAIKDRNPGVYQHDELRTYVTWPEANSFHDKGIRSVSITEWHRDIQQRIRAEQNQPTPAATSAAQPDQQGDNMTTTTNIATGDAHDLESAINQCDLLGDDLARIDTSLDIIDEAINSAGNATELVEAFLRSKSVDDTTVGGMASARDMLSADRIKALIDAIAAAKEGVRGTKEQLESMHDGATAALNGADGSIVNGR